MGYERLDGPEALEIRAPRDEDYRTCSVCGSDCEPEPGAMDDIGGRIMFACPKHGAQNVLDPFSDLR
ncbi:hypothetical protein [Arthrobacter sp. AZCC_0090]|uniref:hypothetical protein n=1 Tax=Arthrobacter sp. AZCC_0090 TaxID=2735881 RepID=UPI001616FD1B|nr:hypothetical protein [Arthrobacter sp. AZCC_0090]MBB6404143.1 hypothetical protein [Arthrobacter sp. AZCC_0090]